MTRVAYTLEEAIEVGFLGAEVDSTPDENYSVAGVNAGKPTPFRDLPESPLEGLESQQGFRGVEIDSRPNDLYTFAGQARPNAAYSSVVRVMWAPNDLDAWLRRQGHSDAEEEA